MPVPLRYLRLAAFIASLAWLVPAFAGAKGAIHVVTIDAMKFSPATIVVKAGDRVTWKNSDPFPHTVTSGSYFTSPEMAMGGTWTFTARREGSFTYICTLHPTMTATLIVK